MELNRRSLITGAVSSVALTAVPRYSWAGPTPDERFRLFFVPVKEALDIAHNYVMFEYNDELTRKNFHTMLTRYINKHLQGLVDSAMVVCDHTNNTDEVIKRYKFVVDVNARIAEYTCQLHYVVGPHRTNIRGSYER
jgi:hypothetical protein